MRSFWLVVIATFAGMVANSAALDFWTNRITGTNLILNAADFGNGVFVVGTSVPFRPSEGGILVSLDGRQWGIALDDPVSSIVFGNGIFVAEGRDWIHVSSNGHDWISRLAKGRNLQYGLGQFWLDAEVGPPPGQHRYSSIDGLSWSLRTTNAPSGAGPSLFSNDRFFGFDGRQVYQSFDGVEFSTADGWPLADRSIAYLNGTWICTGEVLEGESRPVARTICVSTNGTDWSRILVDGQEGYQQVVTVSGGRFLLTIEKNYFYESLDGFNWTDHRIVGGTGNIVTRIVYGADSMVALCNHQESIPKAPFTIYTGKLFQSRSLTPAAPTLLSASLLPALSLFDGIPGAGYAIESAESPAGPWRRVTNIFPRTFPYVFLAPDGDQPGRLYRALSE